MLGDVVRRGREAKGLTQESLATLLGISRVQISRIETDEQVTDADRLIALADALDIGHGEILRAAAESVALRRSSKESA